MHWLLACGGLDTPIDNTPQLMVWGHVTLYSSAVLFLQAPVMAFFLRGSGMPAWQRKSALIPAALGLLGVLALWGITGFGAQQADLTTVTGRLAPLAIALLLLALVSLAWNIVYTVGEAPDRLARAERKRHAHTETAP
jgi:Flp pilus assembly protein protease CpaA